MKIIISDENEIWTPDHPALEPFADHVLVFCMNGIKASEKYQCIITEYHPMGLGMSCGLHTAKYRSLKAASNRLINRIDYHEDIVFLTDNNPDGLYPFLAVRSMNYWRYLHLVTMTPWGFESQHRKNAHRAFLENLSSLSSLLVLNNVMSDIKMRRGITLPDLIQEAKVRCGELLPMILYQIQERSWEKAFFDFHTMQYTPLEEGYELANTAPLHIPADFTIDDIVLDPYSEGTMGLIEFDESGLDDGYPEGSYSNLNRVESLVPRVDGKRVCEYLRGLRTKLAEANGIPFESPQCPSVGPCAGTCDKCDEELAWLMSELDRIEPDQRIYPKEILKDWRVS